MPAGTNGEIRIGGKIGFKKIIDVLSPRFGLPLGSVPRALPIYVTAYSQ
jgi:hypothetical protein